MPQYFYRKSESETWSVLFDPIGNFDYGEGYEYLPDVAYYRIQGELEEDRRPEYYLVEHVVKKEKKNSNVNPLNFIPTIKSSNLSNHSSFLIHIYNS